MPRRQCSVCGTANPPFSSNAKLGVDYCRTCQCIQPFVDAGGPAVGGRPLRERLLRANAEGGRMAEGVGAGQRRWRIAIAGLGCENCTFNPTLTVLEDFRPELDHAVLAERYRPLTHAAAGAPLDLAGRLTLSRDFSDCDFVFCCHSRAIPGGPVDTAAFDTLVRHVVEPLAAHHATSPVDGVWLDLHGAMAAMGRDDAEGHLVERVREVVGDAPLVAASFDLHGNFSPRLARGIDVAVAYRTAPHVDVEATRLKALHSLAEALRKGERPHLSYVPIPLAVSGEMSNTADVPARELYTATLHEHDDLPGVVDCSVLIGYVWADEPRSRASALVTGYDVGVADAAALSIAKKVWERRSEFRFGVPAGPVDDVLRDAVAMAAARGPADRSKPVIVSDSGDNPTAGGVGDVPFVLGRLVALGVADAVCQGPVDAAAVRACVEAGEGATVRLSLGGKMDHVNGTPLEVEATVVRAIREPVTYPRPGGGRDLVMPPAALIRVATSPGGVGGVLATVTSERKPFHYEADFRALGAEPSAHPVLVVKIGYLVPDLERLASRNLMALSPGAVYADVATMRYKRIARPVFPLDKAFEWEPALA